MTAKPCMYLIAALLGPPASGQGLDRAFDIAGGEAPQVLVSMANIVRSIGDIPNVSVDSANRRIQVHGTADQLAVAEWLCNELSGRFNGQASRKYLLPGNNYPVVQIFFLTHVKSPQDLQSITNAARSVTDIQRFFPHAASNAVVMRGSSDQIALADWLLRELDQSAAGPASEERPVTGAGGGVFAKIFYLKDAMSPQELQQVVNLTRSIADIQRFFPYSARNAIVARASAEQLALSAWLIQTLEDPAGAQATQEFRMAGSIDPVVRVFFLRNTATEQALQEITNGVRSAIRVQRAFPFGPQKAVAIRGTADQISQAEQFIKERDR